MRNPRLLVGRGVRLAFTLMEILIVVVLVSLLAGISVAVFMKTSSGAQISTSQSMLLKLQLALDKQWTAVREAAQKDPSNVMQAAMQPLWNAGFPKGNADLNRENYVMLKLQQAFPRTFNEVLQSSAIVHKDSTNKLWYGQLPPVPTYTQNLKNYGLTPTANLPFWYPSIPSPFTPNTQMVNVVPNSYKIAQGTYHYLLPAGSLGAQSVINQETYAARALESSVCLLMALQRSVSGTGFTPEQLGKASIKEVKVQPGNHSVPALVDAWGQPIWFVFESTEESAQSELRPALLSAGPNFVFDSTVTQTLPLAFAATGTTALGTLGITSNSVSFLNEEAAKEAMTKSGASAKRSTFFDLSSR